MEENNSNACKGLVEEEEMSIIIGEMILRIH
jgi:hypothetical protein